MVGGLVARGQLHRKVIKRSEVVNTDFAGNPSSHLTGGTGATILRPEPRWTSFPDLIAFALRERDSQPCCSRMTTRRLIMTTSGWTREPEASQRTRFTLSRRQTR